MAAVLNKREAKKILSKQQIVDAAVLLFSTKGLKETSIADITKEAHLGIGTFYNYFHSKDDLLNSLLENIANDIQKYYTELLQENLPKRELLRNIVIHSAEVLAYNRFILPLFMRAADKSARTPGSFDLGMGKVFPFKPLYDKIIIDGQNSGEFSKQFPAEIVTEMFHSLFQTASFSSLSISYSENVRYKLDLIIAGITAK